MYHESIEQKQDMPIRFGGPAGIRTPDPRLSLQSSEGLHDQEVTVS